MRESGGLPRESWVHEKGLPRVCLEPLSAHLGQRLLLATDLSAASRPAERRAMQLAEETDARLLILAVVPSSTGADHDAVRRLQARTRLARRRGIDAAGRLVIGDPAECILQAAATDGADAIIMGAAQWRAAGGCPCGHVVLHSRCLVLVTYAA